MCLCLGSKCAHLRAHTSFMREGNASDNTQNYSCIFNCPETGELPSVIADN